MAIFDLHQDLLLHLDHPEYFLHQGQTSWELLETAAVKTVTVTTFPVPTDENWFDRKLNDAIEADFNKYRDYVASHPNWKIIKEADDLKNHDHGMILHIEGLNTLSDAAADWELLQRWYSMGWRSLGLVWNLDNALGGGTNGTTSLTDFGEKVIEWCLERQMIIDCAHMNQSTFYQTAALLKSHGRPILVSHGNASAVFPSVRNYDNNQIRQISESGGVIGVFFSGTFTGPADKEKNIDSVIAHLEHIRSVGGDDVVALGTDFGGILKSIVTGLGDITTLSVLLEKLRKRGWTEEQIQKLTYENAYRTVGRFFGLSPE